MSTLKVDTISPKTSWTTDEIAGNTIKQSDAGTTLQTTASASVGSTSVTSLTYVDTDHQCSITPVAAGSKILVRVSGGGCHADANMGSKEGHAKIMYSVAGGSSTDISVDGSTGTNAMRMTYGGSNYSTLTMPVSLEVLHSPSYTLGQSIRYNVWVIYGSSVAGGTWIYGFGSDNDTNRPVMVVQEIAG